jgi:hypothetical protein
MVCSPVCGLSPGLIDIQINGAYGFDFSVYDGNDAAYRDGLRLVAEKIVETGVTACVYLAVLFWVPILTLDLQPCSDSDRMSVSSRSSPPVITVILDPREILVPQTFTPPSPILYTNLCSFTWMACRGSIPSDCKARCS